ncbi:MAG: SHSP domain-containing protein [Burkholderia sp.]|jgi:HSP20 family molecular chaperone IbpA
MFVPAVFGENLFDDFDPFSVFDDQNKFFGRNANRVMKTDVRETDKSFELDIDLPGFDKKDITASLKDGYLTVSAQKSQSNDEKDKKGRYVRRERWTGAMSRSFYVGDRVKEGDIHAKYENGMLQISVPKVDALPAPEQKQITIA